MEVTTCKSGKIPKVEHAITKIATQKILKLRNLNFWGIIKSHALYEYLCEIN